MPSIEIPELNSLSLKYESIGIKKSNTKQVFDIPAIEVLPIPTINPKSPSIFWTFVIFSNSPK
jgi:hypothetical protein